MADVPTLEGTPPPSTDDPVIGNLANRQEKLETLMQYVVLVLLLMTASLIVAVGGIVVDVYQNEAAQEKAMVEQMRQLQECMTDRTDCASAP